MMNQLPIRGGFTLLEMMGVIVVMAIVLGFTTDYYIDLSRSSNRAAKNTSEIRRAVAVLDRVARDLESTMLVVKAPEQDPLDHPWLFVAEAHNGQAGSDHIKFVTRNFHSRRSAAHESDLALVAYTFSQSETDDNFELRRWSSSQLPDSLDRSFPEADDAASFLLADGIADFGLTFTDENGGITDVWDSTTLAESGSLPTWVEISVAMAKPPESVDRIDADFEEEEFVYYRRRVHLPVRPIDMVALLDPEAAAAAGSGDEESDAEEGGKDGKQDSPFSGLGDEGEVSNKTLGDCLDLAGLTAYAQQSMPSFSGYVKSNLSMAWSSVAPILPAEIRPFVLNIPGCQ
jgi:prepilin-type N-terminal cleavage/methylation domain-containing protein